MKNDHGEAEGTKAEGADLLILERAYIRKSVPTFLNTL